MNLSFTLSTTNTWSEALFVALFVTFDRRTVTSRKTKDVQKISFYLCLKTRKRGRRCSMITKHKRSTRFWFIYFRHDILKKTAQFKRAQNPWSLLSGVGAGSVWTCNGAWSAFIALAAWGPADANEPHWKAITQLNKTTGQVQLSTCDQLKYKTLLGQRCFSVITSFCLSPLGCEITRYRCDTGLYSCGGMRCLQHECARIARTSS